MGACGGVGRAPAQTIGVTSLERPKRKEKLWKNAKTYKITKKTNKKQQKTKSNVQKKCLVGTWTLNATWTQPRVLRSLPPTCLCRPFGIESKLMSNLMSFWWRFGLGLGSVLRGHLSHIGAYFEVKWVPEPFSNHLIFEKNMCSRNQAFPHTFYVFLDQGGGPIRPRIAPRQIQDCLESLFLFLLNFRFDVWPCKAPFCSHFGLPKRLLGAHESWWIGPSGSPRRSWDRLDSVLAARVRLFHPPGLLFGPSWGAPGPVLSRLGLSCACFVTLQGQFGAVYFSRVSSFFFLLSTD